MPGWIPTRSGGSLNCSAACCRTSNAVVRPLEFAGNIPLMEAATGATTGRTRRWNRGPPRPTPISMFGDAQGGGRSCRKAFPSCKRSTRTRHSTERRRARRVGGRWGDPIAKRPIARRSDEALSQIAEPFFTTRAPSRGMGLGTYLLRVFVGTAWGGLVFESEPEIGSKAILEIPLIADGDQKEATGSDRRR